MTTEMACSCALYFVDHSVLNQNLTQTGEVSKHFDVVNIFTFENHSLLLENYIQAFDDWMLPKKKKNVKKKIKLLSKQQGMLVSVEYQHPEVSSASWRGYKPPTHRSLGVITQKGPTLLRPSETERA